MNLLLDTHLLLRAAGQPEQLSVAARKLINAPQNELIFSSASIWEIVIKHGLKQPDFEVDARLLRRGLLDNGYIELTINSSHVLAVDNLPPIHKDPFDRILIAQAMVDGMLLLTADPLVARYPGSIQLI